MKTLYDVPAPAKLNLFLHVSGRRADGYHLLQSVFVAIDWCDWLSFELRPDGQVSRSDEGGAELPAEDLCMRAARALKAATGTPLGVHIHLDKRIPAQAGMGGGSSDAASCLRALQRLWGVRLPAAELAALALQLGADVPFFLGDRPAWVEGIGEELRPLALPATGWLVVKPPGGASTPAIFGSPSLKRDSEPATLSRFAACDALEIFKQGRNDLQAVAQALCPEVDQALAWLTHQGLSGRMTGSGSAVFAPLAFDASLRWQAPPAGWQVRRCSNLEMHPLAGW